MGRRLAPLAAIILFGATLLLAGSRVPPDSPNAALGVVESLVVDGWAPALWLISAIGLGHFLAALLGVDRASLRAAVGIAAMLALDQAAGSLGWLAGATGAWLLLLPGVLLAARALMTNQGTLESIGDRIGSIAALAPALAVLALASTSSPGFLWSTEFQGFDALSYHLPLPRAWLEGGAIAPLPWNAYSYLPNWVEGAFLHAFALGGDPVLMGIRAQLLHALIGLVAIWALADAAGAAAVGIGRRRDVAALLASAALIGTPWIVVTASLAYNEMGAMLGAAGLLAAILDAARDGAPLAAADRVDAPRRTALRHGVLLGLFAATAVGSKLSSGVIVLPAAAAFALAMLPLRRDGGTGHRLAVAAVASATAMLALLPWLLRNAVATGNPLFPFAAEWLGSHDWSPDQLRIWREAHGATGSAAERLRHLWEQVFIFGLGANPRHGEPWRPFMAFLPWLGIGGAAWLIARRPTRRIGAATLAALAAALLGWILFTHMKSRFMVPAAPFAALAFALAAAPATGIISRTPAFSARLAALLLAIVPVGAFLGEGRAPAAMIGAERVRSGDVLAELLRSGAARPEFRSMSPSREFVINHELAPRLESEGRVLLLIGDATTFRYRAPFRASTVWTRDPLVTALVGAADDAAIREILAKERVGWVLIDTVMLPIWARSGWLDPGITLESISRIAGALGPPRMLEDGALLVPVGAATVEDPPRSRPSTAGAP